MLVKFVFVIVLFFGLVESVDQVSTLSSPTQQPPVEVEQINDIEEQVVVMGFNNSDSSIPLGYRESSSSQKVVCTEPLGMENGDIKDDQIFVSSSIDDQHGKEQARLNSEHSWKTFAEGGQYLQITFRMEITVTGLKVQGKGPLLRVTGLQFLYRANDEDSGWKAIYEDDENSKGPFTFDANVDDSEVKTIMFNNSIKATSVRIVPVSWPPGSSEMALRTEILGCIQASGCGGEKILTSETGNISSSNYPNPYGNNAKCDWEIKAPKWKTVSLSFVGEYGLEVAGAKGCLDFIEISDVVNGIDKLLGKMCGENKPGNFTSTEETLKVSFITDHFDAFKGFQAVYKFVNASKCGGPQLLREKTGELSSDNWPSSYSNNIRCIWDIEGAEDELIEITFHTMEIYKDKDGKKRSRPRRSLSLCPKKDSLQILTSSVGGQLKTVERYCESQQTPFQFLSSTNAIRIAFSTDLKGTAQGFHASYKMVKGAGSQCGGKRDINNETGILTSPGYPKPYEANLDCEWHIICKPSQAIRIELVDIDMEENNKCEFDSLQICDGSRCIATYCSLPSHLEPMIAYGGLMKVIFHSDKWNNGRGFKARYEIGDLKIQTNTSNSHPITTTRKETTTRTTTTETPSTSTTTMELTTTKTEKQHNDKQLKRITSPSSLPYHKEVQNHKPDTSSGEKTEQVQLTKEMVKWVIIGLTIVSGVLLIVVMLGVIVCCKHNAQNNTMRSLQGSFANRNNSGVMQNHAYDFSINSTNHSIRSKQVEIPDPSHISEPASRQGTLRRAPSQESHIYFSIEECPKSVRRKTPSIKSYYKRGGHVSSTNNTSDESTTAEYEMEEITTYNEDDDEMSLIGSRKNQIAIIESRALSSDNESLPQTSVMSHEETMVDNILYQSADDSGK